jgi:1-acyl-sn-glycerol-3-phosphate acyltransferase
MIKKKRIFKKLVIFFQIPIYFFTLALFKIFCNFKVSGLNNLDDIKKPIIFAPNHSSEWDGILVRVALPFFSKNFSPMYFVSMLKEFYKDSGWRKLIYGGIIFNLLGAYPVYFGKKDYSYSLQNHIKILKNGGNVCIFPEGRRTKDGNFGEAHGGVCFLSYATGAPIVPVFIKGLVRLRWWQLFSFKREVSIVFGKPVYLKNKEGFLVDFKLEAKKIMELIVKMVDSDKKST